MRLAFVLICAAFASITQGADAPRYRLPAGKTLEYASTATSKDQTGGESSQSASWKITVVARNDDGSVKLLVRNLSKYSHRGGEPHERAQVGVFSVHPDGKIVSDSSSSIGMSIRNLFPLLPPAADAKEWKSPADWDSTTYAYTFKLAKDALFIFESNAEGPINKIYETTNRGTNTFDPAKGVITRVEYEHTQGYGFQSKGTGTMTLDKQGEISPKDAAELGAQFAIYFDATRRYNDAMRRISEDPSNATKLIEEAKSALTSALAKVTHPDAKKELEARLKEHEQYASYSLEEGKRLSAVLDKPGKDWSSTDLDGQVYSAKGLKGKVVVMDFWYRGCGWCMYAMPQVKQLADDYRDKPVAILGMNTDQKLEDAWFVVKAMQLDYPQIKATGIPEKFGVQGFPTLVIIDQEGVVRGVHVGYSPDLREKVSKKIDELLAKQK